jgi:outer membrane lipopolysaccharide assembly protein LptE/RlpB
LLKTNIKRLVVLLCCLSVGACGYRFSGGGDLPNGIRKISVIVLENRTGETGFENVVTNDLIYEFTRSGKASITDKNVADAVLSGVIQSMREDTVSRQTEQTSLERRVTISVDLRLVDADGEVLWAVKGLSANETYDVESDKLATELRKEIALAKLSKRFAEKVYSSMTDDF